jgi:hypothetical protein
MPSNAEFNRWDVVEAWFVWLCAHHCGVVHDKSHKDWWFSYNRLSTMGARLKFRPAPNLTIETLTENAKVIYDNLCERAKFCDCLKESNNGS